MKNFILLFIIVINIMGNEKYITSTEKKLYGKVRTSLDSEHPTKNQILRKNKFTKLIKSLSVPVLESLPVIEDDKSIKSRSAIEISQRAIAIALCALKGEGVEQSIIMEHIKLWNAKKFFTKDELDFINNEHPSDSDKLKFGWRYECLHILLWALGYTEKIEKPNKICDASKDISIISKYASAELLAKNSKLRNISDILDMADYYYRLHWGAIELRLNGKTNDNINEEIIYERHYVLNWLIRYMNQKWDEIQTDT